MFYIATCPWVSILLNFFKTGPGNIRLFPPFWCCKVHNDRRTRGGNGTMFPSPSCFSFYNNYLQNYPPNLISNKLKTSVTWIPATLPLSHTQHTHKKSIYHRLLLYHLSLRPGMCAEAWQRSVAPSCFDIRPRDLLKIPQNKKTDFFHFFSSQTDAGKARLLPAVIRAQRCEWKT